MSETTEQTTSSPTINQLLEQVIASNASDLHFTAGLPPLVRVDGDLQPLSMFPVLTEEAAESLVFSMLNEEKKKLFLEQKEIDLSFSHENKARFRVNAYYQQSQLAVAIRLIPAAIPSLQDLQLPEILSSFCTLPHGLILVTGPTGQGKSTTLAAMIQQINETRNAHILSIEDPIEYVFTPKKSLISQREMYHDTQSWEVALRSALREDANVVLIGEMRDYETIASAITIAETGHLVFATLHTNSAAQAVDRIIDVFPEHQQRQIRVQLSVILEAVVSQRLVQKTSGGRIAAVEVMTASPAVTNLIREGKTHQLDNVIATSSDVGMLSLEYSLATLVKSKLITEEVAMATTARPQELVRILRR